MKFFLLVLMVAVTTAAPLSPIDHNEPVELIVNGVSDGEPLEIGNIVDIKLKQHVDGQIASVSDLLYPLTAQGIADAIKEEELIIPEPVPELGPIVLPEAVLPIVPEEPVAELEPVPELPAIVPEDIVTGPILLPAPELPAIAPEDIVTGPILIPAPELPAILPEDIVTGPILIPVPEPEVVDKPEVVETPQFPNGEIFNDGTVQVTVNAETGIIPTIQNWVQLFLNYFSNGVQTSHQIV